MSTPDSLLAFRVDAVAGRLRRLLNEGMLALLTGVGDRSGLLHALTAVQPATRDAVVRATGLDRALVEGWLGAMVAGRIVEYDGVQATYSLPEEYTVFLAGAEGRAYRDRLTELCELASGCGAPRTRASVFRDESALVPPLEELLALVPSLAARVARGARVLELACGTGRMTRALAAAHPASRCVGRDSRRDQVLVARRLARTEGLANVTFNRGGTLPARATARFDVVFALSDTTLAQPQAPQRLFRLLTSGGCGVLAVPATSGSPADDAHHPFGAFLSGARALATAPIAPPSVELGPRLAAAGFEVSALARVATDPFRTFFIVRTPPDQPGEPS